MSASSGSETSNRAQILRERAIERRKNHDKIAQQKLEAAIKALADKQRWRAMNYAEEAARALAVADSWHHEVAAMTPPEVMC